MTISFIESVIESKLGMDGLQYTEHDSILLIAVSLLGRSRFFDSSVVMPLSDCSADASVRSGSQVQFVATNVVKVQIDSWKESVRWGCSM